MPRGAPPAATSRPRRTTDRCHPPAPSGRAMDQLGDGGQRFQPLPAADRPHEHGDPVAQHRGVLVALLGGQPVDPGQQRRHEGARVVVDGRAEHRGDRRRTRRPTARRCTARRTGPSRPSAQALPRTRREIRRRALPQRQGLVDGGDGRVGGPPVGERARGRRRCPGGPGGRRTAGGTAPRSAGPTARARGSGTGGCSAACARRSAAARGRRPRGRARRGSRRPAGRAPPSR